GFATLDMRTPGISTSILLSRHLPRPTLFPYTTLFRSDAERHRDATGAARPAPVLQARHRRVRDGTRARRVGGDPRSRLRHRGCGDRKSTRLNSSHRTISYAVFCLKKKTNL